MQEIQEIPFETIYQDDINLVTGETKIQVVGVNGKKELTYSVTYEDGKEKKRDFIGEIIVSQPVNKLVLTGAVKPPAPIPAVAPKPLGPAENVQASAKNMLGERLIEVQFNAENGIATVKFRGDYSYSKKTQMAKDIVKTAQRIYQDEGAVQKIYFSITGGDKYQDIYGNSVQDPEIALIFLYRSTAEKINADNFDYDNFPIVADYYKEQVNLD